MTNYRITYSVDANSEEEALEKVRSIKPTKVEETPFIDIFGGFDDS